MGIDKHSDREQTNILPEIELDSLAPLTDTQRQMRLIIRRAAVAYLLLFLGAGIVMSLFGVDPLARNGLMPKALLLFVGLSTVIALVNTMMDYTRETGVGWFGLAQHWFRLTFRKEK